MKRLLALALILAGAAHAQTATSPQVWSCNTGCNLNGDTYSDGAWRDADSPVPTYVAASTGTACSTNYWNATVASGQRPRWVRPQDLTAARCVSARRSTSEDLFLAGSAPGIGYPPATAVNCVVSAWSACSLVTGQRTRTIVTPASNGGTACPALSEPCTLPAPTVLLTISANPIIVGQSITATWSSTDAATCSSTWAPSVPLAGSAPLGPFTFAQNVEITVTCASFFGNYQSSIPLIVTPAPTKSPPCWPHAADVFIGRVKFADLQTPHPTYSIKATWFCAAPEGPIQETWATSWTEVFERAVEEQTAPYDEAAAAAQCEATCETNLPAALQDELDAFAALFTVEQLGVVP